MTAVNRLHLMVVPALMALLATSTVQGQSLPVLDAYVEEGLANNLALQQRQVEVDQGLQALREARGMFLPEFNVEARYTRAGGGREITFPVGDLLNPVYGTLNELLMAQGQDPGFPTIQNESFPFFREREQETKLRMIQPVYQPALSANLRIKRHMSEASEASLDTYRQTLVRDIKVAYYRFLQAEEANVIYANAQDLVDENLRVNERLLKYAKVTDSAVLRARAEQLAVEQEREEALYQRDLARSYFNFLLNRDLDAEIERVDALPMVQYAGLSLGASTTELETRALASRAELDQLNAAVAAAEANVSLSRAAQLPGIAVAVDLGIQGTEYGFNNDRSFYMASLVLQWNIFNGFQNRSRIQQAQLGARQLRLQREELTSQIQLQVQEAHDKLRVSQRTLEVAQERLHASEEGFRVVARRYGEGMENQVSFLDARTTFTNALLNRNISQFDVLIRMAELEYAAALPQGTTNLALYQNR